MSTTSASPVLAAQPSLSRRESSKSSSRSPSRPMHPPTITSSGVSRTKHIRSSTTSPVSAKSALQKNTVAKDSVLGTADDFRAETLSLVDDLKTQLRKAETASEEYQKQLVVLQSRLDDALGEQSNMEELTHASSERIETLQEANRRAVRQNAELQRIYEAEKKASLHERSIATAREEELNDSLRKLRDSIVLREHRRSTDAHGVLTRSASSRGRSPHSLEHSPPGSSSLRLRGSSGNSAHIILQKDRLIESLRLELAEAHIRLLEVESTADGRLQGLEKELLEIRMTNAKLMEDAESYQILLQEKTLNGDFTEAGYLQPLMAYSEPSSIVRAPSEDPDGSNLADELETIQTKAENENLRRLENEISGLKDQNKALALYINKIITRLLQNETFESLFEREGNSNTSVLNTQQEKKLPSTPGEDGDRIKENAPTSLLQRAGSIFSKRPRPAQQTVQVSGMEPVSVPNAAETAQNIAGLPQNSIPTKAVPATNEDPVTAPSVTRRPLAGQRLSSGGRSHGRANSDWSASIVNNMYRGPPSGSSGRGNGGSASPSGLASPRQTSIFALAPPPPLMLGDDDNAENTHDIGDHRLSRAEAASDSGYSDSAAPGTASRRVSQLPEPDSPQRSAAASSSDGRAVGGTVFTSNGATSNKIRPLRLVQERKEADEAALAEKKRANRASVSKSGFMGWLSRASSTQTPGQLLSPQLPDGRPPSAGSQG